MSDEKTEKPTPKRLRDARQKGEVVTSSDVTSTVVFIGVATFVFLFGPRLVDLSRELWVHATSVAALTEPDKYVTRLLWHAGVTLMWAMAPIALVEVIFAVAGSFMQVGGLMAFARIKPDMNRLNPAAGLKRIFSTNNLINLAKMIVKTILLGFLMYLVVKSSLETAIQAGNARALGVLQVAGWLLMVLCAWSAVIYIVMAAFDYVHVRYEFMKQNRMSKDEVRREHKDQDGDPHILSRRRAVQQEAAFAGIIDRVRVATVVVNSTQVAVALQYLGEKDLPRVIAKGKGEVASQIIRAARQHLIPCALGPDLAERLHDEVLLDKAIPRHFYKSVALLLRWAQGQE